LLAVLRPPGKMRLSRLAAAGKAFLPIIDTIIVLQCFF
jgi:hypothetical protein